jgi:NAD(P)-dependent dehydrogenase (short-subunit alcohol dehydrogenase family)
MKKALIIGSTGTIGSAVIKAFADAGYEVTGASRNTSPSIDIEDPVSIEKFFIPGKSYDTIICAAGNATFGDLELLNEESFRNSFNSKLTGQIRVVQSGLPVLNTNGVILLTGGMFAFEPWPGTSAIAAANCGLEGFVRAVTREIKDLTDKKSVRIIHPPLVAETAKMMNMDPAPWPFAADVAGFYLKGATGEAKNEVIYVDGYSPKVLG